MLLSLDEMNQETTTTVEAAERPKDTLLGKHHEITSFASKDASRLVLGNVHYKADKQCVEACNGRALIRVPVTISEDFPPVSVNGEPKDCLIPVAQYSKALKNIGGNSLPVLNHVRFSVSGDKDAQRVNLVATDLETEQNISCRPFDGNYPNTDMVIPDWDPKFSVCISAHVLKTLVDYAAKHGKTDDAPITFSFKDENSAVQFRVPVADALGGTVQATGVLMPMRMK